MALIALAVQPDCAGPGGDGYIFEFEPGAFGQQPGQRPPVVRERRAVTAPGRRGYWGFGADRRSDVSVPGVSRPGTDTIRVY
jgi:hypothetical protein